jgi:hypothetical protein
MGYFRRIAKQTFTAPLVLQGPCGATGLGTHSSTMELFFGPDNDGLIEWDIPALARRGRALDWFVIDTRTGGCLQ